MENELINNQIVCPDCGKWPCECPDKQKLNILVVGDQTWIKSHQDLIKILQKSYTLEYKIKIKDALQRLWHNSYDILLIDQEFVKRHTIDLTRMAYARSKPSIILCKGVISSTYYKLWKRFSKMSKACPTMKQLMFPVEDIKGPELLQLINKVALSSHQGLNLTQQINLEISQYFKK